MRSLKDYAIITVKGMAMGAADVVPGVSGGTIALIAGIYKELINTLTSLNVGVLKTLKQNGIKAAFDAVNGKFLVSLVLGIFISVLSLAKIFNYLIHNEPVLVWAFFFGLIVASVWLIGSRITKWNSGNWIALIIGALISFGVTVVSPAQGPDTYWYLFLSGVLAFVAMILPGISGSFILLLLGAYHLILGKVSALIDGVKGMDFTIILTNGLELGLFAVGGIVGLLSFSRILKWMFEKYENRTLALLTGFLIGSLNKVWPWKSVEEVFVKHAGEAKESVIPLVEKNVLPNADYAILSQNDVLIGLTDKSPQIGAALGLFIVGFLIIFVLERISSKKS
jgi:putative membrane protein